MVLVAAALLAVYAALGLAIVAVQRANPGWALYLDLVAIGVVVATVAQYRSANRLLLRSVGAKIVYRADQPALYGHIDRLAALADITPPRVALVDSSEANAFAVGTRRRAVVAVTSGLRKRLDGSELSAVLAHEISHVA